MKKRSFKTEKAEVMVEASLILSVAVIVIFMLLYLGLIMYHQTLITATANQAATNIAQVYSNKYKDPISGFVDVSNLDREGIVIKMKSEEYANTIKTQAEWYSKYRMAKGEILNAEEPKVTVKIENKNGALLRAQVVVDVEQTYKLPLIKMFGVDNPEIKYEAEGRADCSEIMDYVNIIEAADKIDVTENFIVTFYKKDKKSIYKTVEVMHDMSIAETSKISAAEKTKFPSDPILNNERFYLWKTATGEVFTKDTIVTGNISVYPEYDCHVKFMDYDGKTVLHNLYAHRLQPFKNGGSALPSGPAEKGDNKFYSWWYNSAVFDSNTIIPDADAISVTISKCFWVKFNANGGSVEPNKVYVEPTGKGKIKEFPSASKVGDYGGSYRYTLRGWFNNGKKYDTSTIIDRNLVLTADWYCKQHQFREIGRVGKASCERITINYACGICSYKKNETQEPTGAHYYKACNIDHKFDPNVVWKICSGANGEHSFDSYRHKFCIYCHHEDPEMVSTYFKYKGKKYYITRYIVWCGRHQHAGEYETCPGTLVDHNQEVNNMIR